MRVLLVLLFCTYICIVAGKIAPPPASTHRKLVTLRGGGSSAVDELCALDWRFFAAGGICAAFSHGITTPIDVVKTRMQTDPERYSHGVIQATKDIVSEEGVGYLLAGLGPTVVGYGLEGALKFGIYETFKTILKTATPYEFINYLLASIIAGAVASIVLCPMEEARIKMVGDASWARENVFSSILRLMREDGVLSSFSGLTAMLAKQVPYTMAKQVSFDLVAAQLYAVAAHLAVSKESAKLPVSLSAAFLASILACLASQPGDMILTATYQGKGAHGHVHEHVHSSDCAHGGVVGDKVDGFSSVGSISSKGFGSIVAGIYRQHGLAGFYLGVQARLAHVASIITSQLVVYDLLKIALGLPLTGSH